MGDDERLIEGVKVFECLWKVNSKKGVQRSACIVVVADCSIHLEISW